jgi:hypothetical protein
VQVRVIVLLLVGFVTHCRLRPSFFVASGQMHSVLRKLQEELPCPRGIHGTCMKIAGTTSKNPDAGDVGVMRVFFCCRLPDSYRGAVGAGAI